MCEPDREACVLCQPEGGGSPTRHCEAHTDIPALGNLLLSHHFLDVLHHGLHQIQVSSINGITWEIGPSIGVHQFWNGIARNAGDPLLNS